MKEKTGSSAKYCANCHYPLPDYGKFCSNCGQKFTDGRIPLFALISDFIDSVFNLDSRFFRTLAAILIPGKLTNDYFSGRQRRYASPARLFFVSAILHFAALGLILGPVLERQLGENNRLEQAHRNIFMQDLDRSKDTISLKFRDRQTARAVIDTLLKKFEYEGNDSITIASFSPFSGRGMDQHQIAYRDLYSKHPDSLVTDYKVEGFWEELTFKQIIKLNKDEKNFTNYAIGKLIWMVVLMMPALAFILKILYIRRKRYFVEHLVFSFHYHAFAFLVVALTLLFYSLGNQAQDDSQDVVLTVILPILILFYLFFAMKRVYKQGYIKTFFKFSFLNFSYLIIFISFLTMTVIVSALLF